MNPKAGIILCGLIAALSLVSHPLGQEAHAGGSLQAFTITPCRAVDTRLSSGGAIPAGGSRTFSVVGTLANQGGQSTCGVPSGAQAVFLNVVVVEPSAAGHLTVYPSPGPLPLTSTLNFAAGQTIANGALVAICDPSTTVCTSDFTVTMGPATANLVIDVTGYLASSGATSLLSSLTALSPDGPLQAFTITPCRAVDTRLAGGAIPAGGSRTFSVVGTLANQGGQSTCGVPSGAQAVFFNVVVVGPSAAGHLTVYPSPGPLPLTSTLNFAAGQTIANGALIAICDPSTTACTSDFTVTMGPATANLVIDVTGYLASAGATSLLSPDGPLQAFTITPCRAVDTRLAGGAIPAGGSRTFSVVGTLAYQGGQSTCGIPSGAQAVFLNVVVVGPSAAGHLTVYPSPGPLPLTSTLNFAAGQTIANGALVAICDPSTTACTSDLTVTMGPAAANVVIDIAGYLASSGATPPPPLPTVSISRPASGTTYTSAQTVTITAAASDSVGIARVEFYDGAALKATVTASPYTYAWAVSGAVNGTHSWTAKAYNAAGNSATSAPVNLIVNIAGADTQPPTVSITSPASGATYTSAQTVTITAAASDNVGVARVEFYDGATLKATVSTAPYSYAWAVSTAVNGFHTWTAKAFDAAGNSATSTAVSLTVNIASADTQPPTVSITSPASGATYTSAQTVTITAAASDNVGVARVEFYDGGALKATASTAPYSYAWAISSAVNGFHTWTAKAFDAAGNSATSTAVSLTVNIASSGTPTLVGFVPGLGEVKAAVATGGLAFLASDPFGLSVVNVTNPSAPTVLGTSDEPFFGRAIAVSGSRAVVLGQTTQGLQHLWVLDLTIASRPRVVGELSTSVNISAFTSVGLALNGTGTLAAMTMDASIAVVNLSNPAAPVLLGTAALPSRALAVAVNTAGTYAYVAGGSSHLQIVNLSTRTVAGSLSLAGTQADVAISEAGGNTIAYLASQTGLLQVVDVTNPSAPALKGSSTLSGFGSRVAVQGSLATVLSFDATNDYLDVVNVSNPFSPTRTSSVIIQPGHIAAGLDLTDGVAYVADDTGGLKIYAVTSTPLLQGRVNDDFLGQAIAVAGPTAVILGKDIPSNTLRLEVLDVSNPATPRVVSALPSTLPAITPGTAVALNSTGTLAVTVMGSAGIEILNLSNPAVPTVLGVYDTPGTASAVALNSTATLAYVADGSGSGHLQILNISNPSLPTLAGSLTSLAGTQVDIALAQTSTTTAYLIAQTGLLQIVDVTNPATPSLKGSTTLSGFGSRVAVQGSLAVALSFDSTNSYLDILNVSNPFGPSRVASVLLGPYGTGKGVTLVNGLAYVATTTLGLKIFDLATPSAPVLRTTVSTVGDAVDITIRGGYAYVADFPATIDVINLVQ